VTDENEASEASRLRRIETGLKVRSVKIHVKHGDKMRMRHHGQLCMNGIKDCVSIDKIESDSSSK